ncbi:MAG: M48 family metalloprotease [Acidobacteriota bacterium]
MQSGPVLIGMALGLSLCLTACAVNPATGRRQLSLIGQQEEISMGQDADRHLAASLGLVKNRPLNDTVRRVGQTLAAHSERPGLPWTFRVVDDPVVNAFALPGGFIYVTRGILAHLASEAELAGVLGHEIGHVTSRHSVHQLSKARLAGVGLGLGRIFKPGLKKYDDLTQMGMGLLFLKYGRDDERQADDLGLKYMVRAGYSPASMVAVFKMLDQVSASGGGSTPAWLSTHPSPGDRLNRIQAEVAALKVKPDQGRTGGPEYLSLLDGLVYGENPRHGFFRGDTFYQPEMKFVFQFPSGWKHANQPGRVVAAAPAGGAQVEITLSKEPTPATAAAGFFASGKIRRGAAWKSRIHGRPAVRTASVQAQGSRSWPALQLS